MLVILFDTLIWSILGFVSFHIILKIIYDLYDWYNHSWYHLSYKYYVLRPYFELNFVLICMIGLICGAIRGYTGHSICSLLGF